MTESSEKKIDNTLPYGTTADNIVKLLDAIKNKQGDEKGIKATYTGSKLENTQNTLELLGIISGLNLTSRGKAIAFESDELVRNSLFLKAIMEYPPYEYFLLYVIQDGAPEETEIDFLKNYWGKNDYGTSPNNRNEAASVCFSIFQLAGLGEYIIGRKGKSTRFIWRDNYVSKINAAKESNDEVVSENFTVENNQINDLQEKQQMENSLQPQIIQTNNGYKMTPSNLTFPTTIEIKVDFTDWDLKKIAAFIKLLKDIELDEDI